MGRNGEENTPTPATGRAAREPASTPAAARASDQRTENVRIAVGCLLSVIGFFAMVASFIPTNDDRDWTYPDYTDPEAVSLATTTSGFALVNGLTAAVVFGRTVMWLVLAPFLAVTAYRFLTVLPHFTG